MAASVKIKGDGSGASEKDDSDEKEILIMTERDYAIRSFKNSPSSIGGR